MFRIAIVDPLQTLVMEDVMQLNQSRTLTLVCAVPIAIAQMSHAELLGIGWVISFSRRLAI